MFKLSQRDGLSSPTHVGAAVGVESSQLDQRSPDRATNVNRPSFKAELFVQPPRAEAPAAKTGTDDPASF